jgi:hypothetical protein
MPYFDFRERLEEISGQDLGISVASRFRIPGIMGLVVFGKKVEPVSHHPAPEPMYPLRYNAPPLSILKPGNGATCTAAKARSPQLVRSIS